MNRDQILPYTRFGSSRPVGQFAKYLNLAGLTLLLLIMLVPFGIVVINAFKTPSDYANYGPLSLPTQLSFQGLIEFWTRVDFTNKLINSTVISLSVAVLGVIISVLNAFALGIGRVKGRTAFLIFFLIANTLPHESLAYPLYYFAKLVKLYDTQWAIIIIFSVIQSAFGTYLLSSVYYAFPRELIDAATVDGCNKFRLLIHIVVPISMPSLSVLATFFFIWTWNEFFLPLVILISNARQTVPLAIAILQGQHNMDATTTSASALLGTLPCILFFFLFQRTLTRGMTAGSLR